MTIHEIQDVYDLLRSNRDIFIAKWVTRATEETAEVLGGKAEGACRFCHEDLAPLFDAYVEDVVQEGPLSSSGLVLEMVKRKMIEGFSLSAMEVLNNSFMELTRAQLRETYPDAFNARMNYLERLSVNLQKNEISLACHYEQHLRSLNDKMEKKAAALESQNEAIMEFMNLATHELQSPLWSILGFVSKLERYHCDRLDDQGKHCLARIQVNVADMHRLIEDVTALLTISPERLVIKEIDMRHLIEDSRVQTCENTDRKFQCEYPSKAPIIFRGDPCCLKRMFLQLFQNAALYVLPGEHGHLTIRIDVEELPAHSDGTVETALVMYFQDRGIGVEPQYRDLVFRPMERLKEINVAGSGVGLALARRVAVAHGGNIRIVDGETAGLCLRVNLPITKINKPGQGR